MMDPTPISFDRDVMQEELKGLFKDAANDLLQGAAEDLVLYAERISADYTAAMLLPDPGQRERVVAELTAQLGLLGEIHRIRAVNKGWETFGKIVGFGVRAALAGVAAAA